MQGTTGEEGAPIDALASGHPAAAAAAVAVSGKAPLFCSSWVPGGSAATGSWCSAPGSSGSRRDTSGSRDGASMPLENSHNSGAPALASSGAAGSSSNSGSSTRAFGRPAHPKGGGLQRRLLLRARQPASLMLLQGADARCCFSSCPRRALHPCPAAVRINLHLFAPLLAQFPPLTHAVAPSDSPAPYTAPGPQPQPPPSHPTHPAPQLPATWAATTTSSRSARCAARRLSSTSTAA